MPMEMAASNCPADLPFRKQRNSSRLIRPVTEGSMLVLAQNRAEQINSRRGIGWLAFEAAAELLRVR